MLYTLRIIKNNNEARVAELADAQDLGSCAIRRGGSIPPPRMFCREIMMFWTQVDTDKHAVYQGNFYLCVSVRCVFYRLIYKKRV